MDRLFSEKPFAPINVDGVHRRPQALQGHLSEAFDVKSKIHQINVYVRIFGTSRAPVVLALLRKTNTVQVPPEVPVDSSS